MVSHRSLRWFLADMRGVVRSDERMILLFLLLLSVVALAMSLQYTALILDGLPEFVPSEPLEP